MNLVSVYQHPDADRILYALLKERDGADAINISHNGKTPAWREHLKFFRSKPYRVWFLILTETQEVAGAIYLSKRDEIGVHLFKAFQGRGIGAEAIKELMRRTPRRRYLANLNPANDRSKAMFTGLGFRHVQETYER
ncbi:MAG: GNAT family protein [Hyphomicrobiales bacterium]|nr:GNAT family protein [Hyphomicrobiales bacterium]